MLRWLCLPQWRKELPNLGERAGVILAAPGVGVARMGRVGRGIWAKMKRVAVRWRPGSARDGGDCQMLGENVGGGARGAEREAFARALPDQ